MRSGVSRSGHVVVCRILAASSAVLMARDLGMRKFQDRRPSLPGDVLLDHELLGLGIADDRPLQLDQALL